MTCRSEIRRSTSIPVLTSQRTIVFTSSDCAESQISASFASTDTTSQEIQQPRLEAALVFGGLRQGERKLLLLASGDTQPQIRLTSFISSFVIATKSMSIEDISVRDFFVMRMVSEAGTLINGV